MKLRPFIFATALLWASPVWASYLDMYNLSQDPTLQNRIMSGAIQQCIIVGQEDPRSVPFHRERHAYCVLLQNNPLNYKNQLSISVATDIGVVGDATQNSSVAITPGNAATQAALVTDAHILGAIQGQLNTFFETP